MKLKKWNGFIRVAENKFLNRNVASIVKTYVTPKYMIKYLIQNDFVLKFVDPSANERCLVNVGNLWANFLKIGGESFNVGDEAYNVANTSCAEVKWY